MATLRVTSAAFDEGATIPDRYTCSAENLSPPLAWEGVPERAETLAIVCEDPDAPSGLFVHWVLYNLPRQTTALAEGVPAAATLPDGARQGMNSARQVGYHGPCPPPGPAHRYCFRVYALDASLQPISGMARDQFLQAAHGHILAEGQLLGRYRRG